jgi:hypothetical protein
MLTIVITLLSSLIAMAGVELQLPARHPTGVITGRVVDDEGRPMRRVEVQALVDEPDGAQRTPVPRGKSAATNDRGEFRLFWLDPGTYYIGITAPEPRTTPFLGGDNLGYVPSDPDASFVTTYFPGTAYAAEAKPIQIGSGEIDVHAIRMVVRTTRRIRGTIVNSKLSTKSFGALAIAVYRLSDSEWPLLKKVNAPLTGSDFEIRGGIESGSYRLAVLWRGLTDVYAGTSIVTIGQTDPDVVEVPVSETISIDGNVQAGNGTVPDSLYVVIVPDGPNTPGISLSSTVKANGRFAFEDVPGRYRLYLRGLPENTYVAGVRVGNREFTPDAVDFMPDATSVSIVIKQK